MREFRVWRRARALAISAAVTGALASVAAGADIGWTNAAGDGNWDNPANWSTGSVPGSTDTAVFTNAAQAPGLGNVTRTLDGLRFDESFPPVQFDTLKNGSLVLSRIQQQGSAEIDLVAPVSAAGSTLALENTGTEPLAIAQITASNLIINTDGSSSGFVRLGSADVNSISLTGTVTADLGPIASGTAHLTMNGASEFSTIAGPGVFFSGVTVNDSNQTNTISIFGQSIPPPAPGSIFDFGTLQIGATSLRTRAAGSYRAPEVHFSDTTLSGNAVFVCDTRTSLGSIQGGIYGLEKKGLGELILTSNNAYTGTTTVDAGPLTMNGPNGLGSGPVVLNPTGWLKFAVPQSTFHPVNVPAGAGLAGDLTGAIYSGPGKNVTLAPDACLSPTAGAVPIRGVDVPDAEYWLVPSSNTGSYVVGDGGSSIYKGVIIGGPLDPESSDWNGPSPVVGTISEAAPGLGIIARYDSESVYGTAGAAFNTTNTATGVTFVPIQPVWFTTPIGGSATVFTVNGDSSKLSRRIAALGTVANTFPLQDVGIAANQTLNVSDGLVVLNNDGAVQGQVNLNSGATLRCYGNPVSGTFHLGSGAAFIPSSSSSTTISASMTSDPGGQIVFTWPCNTGPVGATWLPVANADLVCAAESIPVFTPPLSFDGAGLVLDQGRRLENAPGASARTIEGSGISAMPGATNVMIAAAENTQLTIASPINLAGVDLQINDDNSFTTLRNAAGGDYTRVTVAQDGIVVITGNATADDVIVAAGELQFGDGTSNNTYTFHSLSSSGGAISYQSGQLNLDSLNLSGATRMSLESSAANAVHVGTLSIDDSAQLDLANDGLIAGGSNTGTWNGSNYTGITGMIGSRQITSSSIAAGDTLHAIGVAPAADVFGLVGTATATWNGQTVGATDTLVMYTYGGDANLDGKINIDDYGLIDSHVGQSGTVFGWHNGDFNYDGKINIDDYGIIDANIGAQTSTLAAGSSPLSGVASVPEPGACASLAIVLIGIGVRPRARRRRQVNHR